MFTGIAHPTAPPTAETLVVCTVVLTLAFISLCEVVRIRSLKLLTDEKMVELGPIIFAIIGLVRLCSQPRPKPEAMLWQRREDSGCLSLTNARTVSESISDGIPGRLWAQRPFLED